jgi:hypothetical protein
VINTSAVKGDAVCSEQVNNIIKLAMNKLGNERDCGPVIKRDGISFDGKIVLMLVLSIRFANLKVADVITVAKYTIIMSFAYFC